ncbi:MAG: 6-phosphogluconolactonase [Solirubrobacteraceae bacterium]|nr:6-phosphogluconolactonase [Solirubrobacteraceae bacterium]
MELEVLPDKDAVAERAAEILTGVGAGAHVALSGGSTPKQAYALAGERRSDWSGVTLWLGDERHVPASSDDSNARMVREELLFHIPRATLPLFEPVDTEVDLDAAAADYERRLRAALGDGGRLDLALMGLGPDSHTASLFPGKPALAVTGRWAVGVPEPGLEPRVPRVTLTFEVFNAARDVVFVVAGEDKAEAMARAFADPPDRDAPAAHVRPSHGRLLVLADRAAAAHLG